MTSMVLGGLNPRVPNTKCDCTFKAPTSFNVGSLAILVVVVIVSKWAYTLDFG
jgi:hypothetical protein